MSEQYWYNELNSCQHNILDKEAGSRLYVRYMLDRTNQMFEYKGLPKTIPAKQLEIQPQMHGYTAYVEVKGELYAVWGHLGGPPDPYYRPTIYTWAQPALGSGSPVILYDDEVQSTEPNPSNKVAVVMRNDSLYAGLLPMFTRYATEMVENDISIRSAQINSRQQTLISAHTDRDVEAANDYIDGIVAGEFSAVAENQFLEGIRVQNANVITSNSIIQLIELQQYLKASWFNELGLNSNFNMKREYLSAEEIRSSTDMLLPLVDDMLNCRKSAVENINKIFGTSISVDKSSAWGNKESEIEQANEAIAAEIAGKGGAPIVSDQKNEEKADSK